MEQFVPNVKTKRPVDYIETSCSIVVGVFETIKPHVKPGITPLELDAIAEDYILSRDAKPAFKGYIVDGKKFPNTLCISVNDAVVHGIPSNVPLKEGDIISVDCGAFKDGYFGDSAYTFPVGTVDEETQKLLTVTQESLMLGIKKAVGRGKVYDIARAIQKHVESNNFSIVRELVGHGIGKNLHEDPAIPNFVPPILKRSHLPNVKLHEGLCIAIEPMVNAGTKDVVTDKDEWTIRTADGKMSAHFEHTVYIREKEAPLILTQFN